MQIQSPPLQRSGGRGGGEWPRRVDHGHISVRKPIHGGVYKANRAGRICTPWSRQHSGGASRHKRNPQGRDVPVANGGHHLQQVLTHVMLHIFMI